MDKVLYSLKRFLNRQDYFYIHRDEFTQNKKKIPTLIITLKFSL